MSAGRTDGTPEEQPEGQPAPRAPRRPRLRWATRWTWLRLFLGACLLGGVVLGGWASMFRMPGESYRGPLPALTREEEEIRGRLRRSVTALAEEIGERNVLSSPRGLALAASWIESELTEAGLPVESQTYTCRGVPCRNLEVVIPGGARSQETVVVGAHYDAVPGCPGANDNGTGVAALLEMARALRGRSLPRTLRLAAFVNEEPPFFQTEEMGSLIYARRLRQAGEKVVAMISLETMGYYRDEPGSQQYPAPLGLIYPDRGDFIGFVGNWSSRDLVRRSVAAFRETTRFPSEGGAPWGGMPGVGWSDHWSFWQAGYPALMVTDTAPFRYPHYHLESDTPDRIDHERLARVTAGLIRVVERLADGEG